MPQDATERRRGRRITLQVPVLLRRMNTDEPQAFTEHLTENVSLAGVYFRLEADDGLSINDIVMASVSIPESERREFPFTRLAGRSRVVRVSELPSEKPESRKQVGVALEFGQDVTALTTIPMRA